MAGTASRLTFAEWRVRARTLLLNEVPPHEAQWQHDDLLAREQDIGPGAATLPSASLHIPRSLMELIETAACCRDQDRWAFLYRVLWRQCHGEPEVASAADPDGARLHAMAKAVRREEHDMHAYVRFRERLPDLGPPRFVAWFEPQHEVLARVALHFQARMGKATWMIATPEETAMWDGTELHLTGPLMSGPEAIDDAGESLWLSYYRSIFNPARLNAKLMESHIPSRFWKHLPEGAVVPQMVSAAATGARKVGQMESVIRRGGKVIPVTPEAAQPQRQQPTRLDECRRCELWEHATQAVPGEGKKHAKIMLVGEQPGDQEDLAGHPFVGPAGQLLDRALAQADVPREAIYVTNAVKHFKWEPRGKRRLHKTPAQREVDACHYWLEKEVAAVKPAVIVALGSTALKSVLENPHATLKDVLGQPVQHGGRWVVATYHPSYALRVPDQVSRDAAFRAIVDALETARKLSK
jgi:DNA polymerase